MIHQGTKTIDTKRLVLRKFSLADATAMYSNWAFDPEVTKYLVWPPHKSVADSEEVLSEWISQYAAPDFYLWAITLREEGGEPIGSISVVKKNDDLKMLTLGYCIGRKWWNQGIMSESLAGVIKFFFEVVGVNRIEARHDPMNPNSGKVMEHCGMKFEGILREADWNNQGICDAAVYAILAKEYASMLGSLSV